MKNFILGKTFSTTCLYSLALFQYLLMFFLYLKILTAFVIINPVY